MSIVQTFLKCTSYYGNKKNGVFTIYFIFFGGSMKTVEKRLSSQRKMKSNRQKMAIKKKKRELNLYYPECADYLAKEYIARCRDASIYPTSVTEIHVNQPPPQREREPFLYKWWLLLVDIRYSRIHGWIIKCFKNLWLCAVFFFFFWSSSQSVCDMQSSIQKGRSRPRFTRSKTSMLHCNVHHTLAGMNWLASH